MPRSTVALAATGLLLAAALSSGCTLSSDPASDSLGRAEHGASHEPNPQSALLPEVTGAATIEVEAPAEVTYTKKSYRVRAGTLNISFTSKGNHNFVLVGPRYPVGVLWGVANGAPVEDEVHAIELSPGTFTFYCSVQGHRAAGMEGTIRAVGSATATPSATASPSVRPTVS